LFIFFVEAVVLEGVHCDGGVEGVLEVDETEGELAARGGGFRDQAGALEAGEGAEDVCLACKCTGDFAGGGVAGNSVHIQTACGIGGNVE
jgi:hypothetical protein